MSKPPTNTLNQKVEDFLNNNSIHLRRYSIRAKDIAHLMGLDQRRATLKIIQQELIHLDYTKYNAVTSTSTYRHKSTLVKRGPMKKLTMSIPPLNFHMHKIEWKR